MVDDDDLAVLVSSAGLVFVGQILYSVGKLGERLVIARLLSKEAYGEVSIAIAVMTLGVTVGLVGLRQGVPRYVSRFEEERDVRGVWLTGLVIAGLLGVGIAVALVAGSGPLGGVLFEQESSRGVLVLFAAAIPFAVGMQVGVGAIRGLENTVYRTYARDLLYPGLRLGLIVALLLAGLGVHAVGVAYLVATVGAFLVAHLLLNRLLSLAGPVRTHAREMLLFSLPLVVSTLLSRLLTWTDTVMLGYFRPSTEVALYSAAFPLASALVLILSSFGFMYLPLASRLDAADEREEVDQIFKLTAKWIYVLTFPLFLTLLVFPEDVLGVTFGARYTPAATVLAILSVGFFTRAAFGRSRETISALGYTTYLLWTNALAFGLNLGLNLLLIPRYGPTGAAVASASSFVALNVVVYLILRVGFDISPFSRWSLRTFLVLPATLGPPALVLSRVTDLTVVTLPVFVVGVELAAVSVVAVTGCLQPEDEVPISYLEGLVGIRVPLVRRYLPEA